MRLRARPRSLLARAYDMRRLPLQMVPRDWFRGGLLKDLAYYRPFAADS